MTWTAVGSFGDVQASTFSLTPGTIGNLVVLDVANFSNSTVYASSVSSSNATWTFVGNYLGVSNTGTHALFLGLVTNTATQTVTPTWSGTAPAGIQFDYHEFHSTIGAWVVDVFTHLDSAGGTTTWPSMTAASAGELYWGFAFDASTAVAGSTSGFVYNVGSATGNGQLYNLSYTSGVSPVWGDGGQQLGMMLLIREQVSVPSPVLQPLPPKPPGWFPGSDLVTADPDGIPFWAQPAPADATPAVIIPPTPEPAPIVPVPPGWFPGADKVVAQPDGIPFAPAPPPLLPAPAVIYPFPELDGEPQSQIFPPGYFPGSQTVSVDPGGIPFYAQPQPLLPPAAPPPPAYIVGLNPGHSGTNGWFVDQYGKPRVYVACEEWGIIANAGQVTSAGGGTWQQDYASMLSARSKQGYTVISVDPYGNSIHGGHDDGSSWDNIAPFTSNFNVFNETYFQRVDYFITVAALYGITVNFDCAYSYNFGTLGGTGTGTLFSTMTLSQATAYGVALGNRYKNTPNLMWFFGDDDNNNSTLDGLFTNILAGIRSTGDTHEASIEYYPSGTTVDRDLSTPTGGTPFNFGSTTATYNWVYYYWVTGWGVEEAYQEPAFPTPVIWGDGFFYGDAGVAANDQFLQRNMVWWALAAGARGVTAGSEATLRWNVANDSYHALTSELYPAQQAFVIRQLLESLPGWYKLAPDLNSVLVTAGRGTRPSYNSGHFLIANSPAGYVFASYVTDGSLAVIYSDTTYNITINQAVMAPGYTAMWVDPSNGATTSIASASTYNSASQGTNNAGNSDWLLVLQGTPQLYPFAEVTQRRPVTPKALLRRGRVVTPVLPQASAPAGSWPAGELRQWRQARGMLPRRGHSLTPVAGQDYPVTETAQRRQAQPRALFRRGRQVTVTPPQFNPPYPFAEIRQERQPRGFFPRRGHVFTPVPVQDAPVSEIAQRRQAQPRSLLRRGRQAQPVPAQQAAAPNPPITFQNARHQPVLFQRRGHVFAPVPPQAAGAPNPAWVQAHRSPVRAIALIRRRFRQLMPWPQAVRPAAYGTATIVNTLAATATIQNTLAATATISDTLAATASITGTLAGSATISNNLAGTATIVNQL